MKIDSDVIKDAAYGMIDLCLCGAAHEVPDDEEISPLLDELETEESDPDGPTVVIAADGRRWAISVSVTELPPGDPA